MNKLLKVLKKSGIVKSSVAALLALSVLLTTFAGMSIFGQGGKLAPAAGFASGTGTSADPYMIENASELLLAVTSKDNAGVYYKLANDIYINNVDSADWYTKAGVNEWAGPVGLDDANAFKGNFNGDGFRVYGLYIKDVSSATAASTQAASGLFPIVGEGAVITAVGVENAYISTSCSADATNGGNLTGVVGALIGATTSASAAKPVKVSLCYADADTYLEGGYIGGIIGNVIGKAEAKSVIVENCYSNAKGVANCSQKAANGVLADFGQYNRIGIIGVDNDNNGVTVYMTGCYASVGNISGTGIRADEKKSNYCPAWNAGAGIGSAEGFTADMMLAAAAKNNMSLLDFENVYKTTTEYPALRVFDREFASEVLSYEVWDGTAEKPTKGTGVASDPYIIENAQQFAWAFQNQPTVSTGEDNWPAYKLMTDIYLNNLNAVNWETGAVRGGYTANTWTPGEVYLQMDGNGHMVYGLYVNRNPSSYAEGGSPAGLIGVNKSNQWESFKNLGVDKAYIHTDGNAGVFIGKMMGGSARATIDRCYVGPDVTIKGYFVSSFVGYGPAVIRITNSANTTDNMTAYKYSEANRDRYCGILGGGVWGGSNLINNSYSVTYLQPNGGESGVNVDNSYGTKRHFQKETIIELDKMQGFDALTNAEKMPNLGAAFKATETFPVPAVLYEAVTGIWDGTVAQNANILGAGTEADPFIIDRPSKAAKMVLSNANSGGKAWYNGHYKITKDLYLNDIEAINWATGEVIKEGYVPNVWVSAIATDGGASTVHGDNHVIRGLYVNDTETDKKHAFWTYSYSGVKMYDLGFDNAFVKAKGPAGIIFSNAKTGGTKTFVFEGCYVGENATVISTANSAGTFYAWGAAANMTFKNCYSTASVSGVGNVGSFAPDVWGNTAMTFENCYGIGAFRRNSNNTWTYRNSYCDVSAEGLVGVSPDEMKGLDALISDSKMPNLGDAYVATKGYPVLKDFPRAAEDEEEEEKSKFWSGAYEKPNEGSGTAADPYLIDTAEELAWSMLNGSKNTSRNMFYKLTADIYLNDTEKVNWSTGEAVGDYAIKQWVPKFFSGTLDGNFHVIYGLYTDKKPASYTASEANGVGFITENEWNYAANFKNLGFDYIYFHGPSSVGALAGNLKTGDNGKITADRVFVGSNVTLKGQSVGGFIGYGGGALALSNCYSLVTNMIPMGAKHAGIIGDVWNGANKAIDNCYALDRIYGNNQPAISFKNNFCALSNIGATVLSTSEMKGLKVLSAGGKLEALGDAFQATLSYPIIKGFENTIVDDGSAYWDGSVSKPAAGTGIFGDPYQITNGAELAWAVNNSENGKYYKVMNDIYLNDIDAIDWTTGALKKETYGVKYWNGGSFEGNLDGNGKVVYGMYINNNATSGKWGHNGKALITAVDGMAVIERLGIDNAYVCNTTGASAFVGSVNSGCSATFNECYVGEKVVLKGYLVGGFVAVSANPVAVNTCYNAMPLENYIIFDKTQSESPKKGGILGDCWAMSNAVTDSWSFETIRTNNGNLVRVYSSVEDHQNAYTPIAIENMKGLDALSSASKMSGLAGCGKFMATNSYPVLRVFVEGVVEDEPEGDIWSGNVASTFAGGKGTKEEPYLIANGAQLALAISKGGFNGSYFKLTKDIYLNDVTDKQWAKNTDNKVWLTNAPNFNGNLDGDGYIIYGLYIPESAAPTSAGLITSFQGGTIKNLGMRYAYVRGNDHAAALVAKTASGGVKYIDKCFADDTCDVAFIGNVYGGAAGIVGYAQPEKTTEAKTFITNCYSKAKLSAALSPDQRANGIIGTAWWSSYSIKNCYSYGYPVYFGANAGTSPWCLYQDGEEAKMDVKDLIDNVYTDARAGYGYENMVYITPRENMTDEMAKTTMPALDFENIWETVTETSPKLKIFTSISGEETDLSKDGEIYASGKGTKKSPYIIMNEAQLRYLLENGNSKNKYYKLGADIYLNDVSKPNWKTDSPNRWYETGYNGGAQNVPNFQGNFDGDGHYIYGLFMNSKPKTLEESNNNFVSVATALFPMVSTGADIRNVHIRNSYISGIGYAGSIAGFIQGSSTGRVTIIGCSADNTVTIKGQTTGGLVGGGTGGLTLYYSYFTGKLEATAAEVGRQGALVGDIWHTNQEVAECYTIGYSNYRPGYVPGSTMRLYGTVSQSGTTVLSEAQMYGAAAKKAMPMLSWDTMWHTVNGKTPHIRVIGYDDKFSFTDEGVKGRPWSGMLATKFAGGSGTEEDPYLIETPEQMAYLISIGSRSVDNHYKLVCDLVINDTTKSGWEQKAINWFTGGDFGGHFDGDGHVISGLYFNGSATYVALFPKLTGGAVIEKLGIINSTLISNVSGTTTQTYVAPFGAYYSGWENETHGWPVIRQCFADDTVYLEGFFVGGLVCGSPVGYHIENCYFTGEITAQDHHGTMIGNIWNASKISTITDSFSASADRNKPSSNNSAAVIECDGYYHYGDKGSTGGATTLSLIFMQGELAKENMPLLDYNKIWMTVEGGTPVLRCFKDAKQYSCTRPTEKVEIAFVTGEGSPVEPIYGLPGLDKIPEELPVPERYGYDFGGWYFFESCDLPFELDVFPEYDTHVYAKWIQRGYAQGFEGKIDESYDFNEGAILFKPGVAGYNPRFVHGGLRSVKTLSDSETQGMFLVSYDNMVKVGNKYDIMFWMNTGTDGASGTIELLHANHGQVDSDIVGYEEVVEFTDLKSGVWQQYKFSTTANAPFFIIRVPAGVELYFDDFQVVDTAEEGVLGEIEGFNPMALDDEPISALLTWILSFGAIGIVILAAGGVLGLAVVAAAIIAIILVIRKKSKKKKAAV